MKYTTSHSARSAAKLISLLLVLGTLLPATARASLLSDFVASIRGNPEKQNEVSSGGDNLQTMVLPKPAMNVDPLAGKGGGEITIVDDSALMPAEGPSGTIADIEKPKNATISVYVVREGDTLGGIAKLFKVSPSTILWANDMKQGDALHVGDKLTVLPVTGVRYTVKKGDTLEQIAKRTGGDAAEISTFNGVDNSSLASGMVILVPDGEVSVSASSSGSKSLSSTGTAHHIGPKGTATQIGYYMRPIEGGVKTQGIHGFNGVDLAAPVGTPILASAAGTVITAKEGGWNAGYGDYVVIQHENDSQTLYAHQSKVIVTDGEQVVQGQVIGYIGMTGKTTGPHVHFEIRNGIRNPF